MAFALRVNRNKTDAGDDADPSGVDTAVTLPPEVEVWVPTLGTTGVFFCMDFRPGVAPWVAMTARVRVYARDATDGTWHLAGDFPLTPNQRLMIQEDLFNHDIWLRLTAIVTATAPTVAIPIRVKVGSTLPAESAR